MQSLHSRICEQEHINTSTVKKDEVANLQKI
jgi:hypothetical protein